MLWLFSQPSLGCALLWGSTLEWAWKCNEKTGGTGTVPSRGGGQLLREARVSKWKVEGLGWKPASPSSNLPLSSSAILLSTCPTPTRLPGRKSETLRREAPRDTQRGRKCLDSVAGSVAFSVFRREERLYPFFRFLGQVTCFCLSAIPRRTPKCRLLPPPPPPPHIQD